MDHKPKIKGILFDFDGTLTYPGALDFPAMKREMNCPQDSPILEFLEKQSPKRRAELKKILEKKEAKAAEDSIPNRGAETCLSSLKKRGIPMGIITRNSLKSVRVALKKFKCITLHDFSAIISREDGPPKPHPEGVHKAAQEMGLLSSELMVVGDFRFDVMAGKAAGAYTVLLADGIPSVIRPEDPEPDLTIDHLEKLLNLF